MSDQKTLGVLFFVLGLFLVALGIGLGVYTEIDYRNYFGYQIASGTKQPYQGQGAIMVFAGIASVIYGLAKTQAKNDSNAHDNITTG